MDYLISGKFTHSDLAIAKKPYQLTRIALLENLPELEKTKIASADINELWQHAIYLERFELVKAQRRHRQVMNISRFLMAYEYAFPENPLFQFFLFEQPVVPRELSSIPGTRISKGKGKQDKLSNEFDRSFGDRKSVIS